LRSKRTWEEDEVEDEEVDDDKGENDDVEV
jgi:hypothetical protein